MSMLLMPTAQRSALALTLLPSFACPLSRLPDCEPHFCDVSPIQWDLTSERWNLFQEANLNQPAKP